ncbi:MAG TPA: hemerythrin domain-containing protein [Mycobacteriales bacterium]|nr:hemerythrin domain-containing protein [Mycobacteriales bacterium]
METHAPDTSDMVAVHRVFRDTLAAAPALINAPAAQESERAALLANYYSNIVSFLEVHHEGEDELLYPLLRDRVPDDVQAIEEIAAQHAEVEGLVAASRTALAAWSADPAAGADAAQALRNLVEGLTEHLDDEERAVLPLCAQYLSVAEWGALPAHGMSHFAGDKVWLILGLIRERMTQAQRDEMLAHMPPPAVQMWTGFGEEAFGRLESEVVGSDGSS